MDASVSPDTEQLRVRRHHLASQTPRHCWELMEEQLVAATSHALPQAQCSDKPNLIDDASSEGMSGSSAGKR